MEGKELSKMGRKKGNEMIRKARKRKSQKKGGKEGEK